MTYTVSLIVKIAFAALFAVILGNGCVVAFNHFPVKWFEDYAEDGSRILPDALLESIESGRQRITSTPWKYIFTALFAISGVFLATRESIQFELAALIVMAIVLEMAISDSLYMIVPDQLSILLAVSAIGFVAFYDRWWEPLAGAGVGALLALAVYGLGRLIYKKATIGGADMKFYVSMGLVAGRSGIVIIFVITTICTAVQAAYLRIVQGQKPEARPMMPCAFAAVTIYMLFLWSVFDIITL